MKKNIHIFMILKNLKIIIIVMKDKLKEELDDSEFYTWFNYPGMVICHKGGTIYARKLLK